MSMHERVVPVTALILSLALPELALARAQPTAPTPVAAAPTTSEAAVPASPADASGTAAVVVVTPSVPPPTIVAPAPAPRPAKPHSGKPLIVAGAATLGTMYFFTTMAGAMQIDRGRRRHTDASGMLVGRDRRRIDFGRSMLVPVVGPFVAMRHTHSALQRWAAAMTGAIQVGGAVLVLAGMFRSARVRRWERMSLGAGPTVGGASLSISGRF